MTLKEWLKLNPYHRATLSAAPDDEVTVVLFGGEGTDQRWAGRGKDESGAISRALEVREEVRSRLP